MRRHAALRSFGCTTTVALMMAVAPAIAQDKKPNIVFILADNVGYGDLGSYGGGELRGAPTPRLDELASQGLRLTQFLVEPACTPFAGGTDDGAVLDPKRAVPDRNRGKPIYASGACLHDG